MGEDIPSDWQILLDCLVARKSPIELNKALDNKTRIAACYSDKLINKTLSQWIDEKSQNWRKKNLEKATFCREEGNKLYIKGIIDKSLTFYSKAIVLAPKGSEELKLAFGNRSAALFRLKMYKECISDIKYSLKEDGIPTARDVRLLIRKAKALEKLNNFEKALDTFQCAQKIISSFNQEAQKKCNKERIEVDKLLNQLEKNQRPNSEQLSENSDQFNLIVDNFNSEPEFPNASSKLSLVKNDAKGRHVIAKKDIFVGEVIYLEKPFAFVILPNYSYERCQTCCRFIVNALPCNHCAEVVFCNENCRKIGWNKFHKWECGFGLELNYMIGIAHLGFRIAIIGLEDPTNPNYERVKNLQQHLESLDNDDLYQYSLTATLLVLYLEKYTNILKGANRLESLLELGGLILLHIGQMVCNGHAITDVQRTIAHDEQIFNLEQVRVATAIYPSASMMNHSCDPSIINGFKDDYLIVRAIKNIKKGEEVYNCYGPHFRRMTREERKSSLLQQYRFCCQCVPCTSDVDFIERFNGYICSNNTCNNIIPEGDKKCRKCSKAISQKNISSIGLARDLMQSAKDLLEIQDYEKSILCARDALKIFSEHLYKHHKDILECKDFIAICLISLGGYEDSYKYVEENLVGNKERYGFNSIEVANEIAKLSDISLSLRKVFTDNTATTARKNKNKYQDIFQRVLGYIKEAQEIYKLHYGQCEQYFELEKQRNLIESAVR